MVAASLHNADYGKGSHYITYDQAICSMLKENMPIDKPTGQLRYTIIKKNVLQQ